MGKKKDATKLPTEPSPTQQKLTTPVPPPPPPCETGTMEKKRKLRKTKTTENDRSHGNFFLRVGALGKWKNQLEILP